MAAELSVEALRDFIALNDGRVKNTALVAHFRKFLNDPNRKSEARQKFKDYVNTVAVVKTEDGEKYVQLKKKYRTAIPVSASSSPLEATDMRDNDCAQASPSHSLVSSFDAPIVPETEKTVSHTYASPNIQGHTPLRNDGEQGGVSYGHPPTEEVLPSQMDPTVTTPEHRKPPLSENIAQKAPTAQMDSSGLFRVPVPPQDHKSVPESARRSSQPGPSTSVEQARMSFQSNNEDTTSLMPSEASLDSSKEQDFDEGNAGNTFAMDPTEKQWMLMAARGNMLELRKLLNKDPNLAEKKDFVLGYTALHWGAKKGNEDLVRMFGDIGVDVNIMSNGGYTPMHLAAMHGHEKIVQILVEEYDGDPHIRNYSGKQARDYLSPGALSLSIQKLLLGNDGTGSVRDFAAGLRPRLDSVRKSKRIGNAISGGVGVLGALVRGKATSNEDVSSISSASPSIGRKGSFSQKGKKKKNRKWSREERPSISLVSSNSDDFDSGFRSRTGSNVPDGMHRGNSASPIVSRPTSSTSRGSVSKMSLYEEE